jgi:hypothetical protein
MSHLAVGVETLVHGRYPRPRDRALLLVASVLEFAGFRQVLAVERSVARSAPR